jgi:hypothetical protein
MGAMLRFKNETGKEVTEIDGGLSDLCTYLYCCVVSASKREGKSFDMSLMDFADSISPEDMDSWSKTIQESAEQTPGDGDDSEKKSL